MQVVTVNICYTAIRMQTLVLLNAVKWFLRAVLREVLEIMQLADVSLVVSTVMGLLPGGKKLHHVFSHFHTISWFFSNGTLWRELDLFKNGTQAAHLCRRKHRQCRCKDNMFWVCITVITEQNTKQIKMQTAHDTQCWLEMDSPYRALVKYLLGYISKSTDLMYQSFRKVNNVVLKLPKIFIAVVL